MGRHAARRRQQEVNQALQPQPLSNQLIQTIAVMSVQRGDAQLSKVIAEQGNPNAREIVEALRRQGISINPN